MFNLWRSKCPKIPILLLPNPRPIFYWMAFMSFLLLPKMKLRHLYPKSLLSSYQLHLFPMKMKKNKMKLLLFLRDLPFWLLCLGPIYFSMMTDSFYSRNNMRSQFMEGKRSQQTSSANFQESLLLSTINKTNYLVLVSIKKIWNWNDKEKYLSYKFYHTFAGLMALQTFSIINIFD